MSRRATRLAVALVAAVIMVGASGAFAAVGDITTFTDPAGNAALPRGITAGPGTDVWFGSTDSDRVGRISTTGPSPAPPEPVVVAPRFTG
jgi:streptogramin lyase